jgi:hypothetical protein
MFYLTTNYYTCIDLKNKKTRPDMVSHPGNPNSPWKAEIGKTNNSSPVPNKSPISYLKNKLRAKECWAWLKW